MSSEKKNSKMKKKKRGKNESHREKMSSEKKNSKMLDLTILEKAVRQSLVIRTTPILDSAGGPGSKVFPPTYDDGNGKKVYWREGRCIEGKEIPCTILDSPSSRANRIEECLLDLWRSKEVDFHLMEVDFTGSDVAYLGKISTLEMPHRWTDALLRDSMYNDELFRETEIGQKLIKSDKKNATALYKYCPHALVLGCWDSTGPKGGKGNKFQKYLSSEIVAFNSVDGKGSSSRLDPVGIECKGGPIYKRKDDENNWTVLEGEAKCDSEEKPVKYDDGKPSNINHGNITPTIDGLGGITMEYAREITVLSLTGVRSIYITTDVNGNPIPEDRMKDANNAARTNLVALFLCALTILRESGYDLRSGCQLTPQCPLIFEFVGRYSGETEFYTLDRENAIKLAKKAEKAAKELGLGWDRGPTTFKPALKLVELIKKSRGE